MADLDAPGEILPQVGSTLTHGSVAHAVQFTTLVPALARK